MEPDYWTFEEIDEEEANRPIVSNRKCKNCKFFNGDSYCHRYPQAVGVHLNHWCGEHKVNGEY